MSAVGQMPLGAVYADDRQIAFCTIEQSEIHNDFYRPRGVGHIIGVKLQQDRQRLSTLTVHRPLGASGFADEEIRFIEGLAPHLIRARLLHAKLAEAEALNIGLSRALDHLPIAALLVDASCRVRRSNATAEKMLRRADPLASNFGILSAIQPPEDRQLRRAVLAAVLPRAVAPAGPIVIRLSDRYGSRCVAVLAVPMRAGGALAESLCLLLVSDTRQSEAVVAGLLTSQFGLTAAEARVAATLSDGDDPAVIAQKSGVSINTVRTQIKAAMAKCGVSTQAQLVARILRSLAGLRHR
jgi:DNA-binding CsgD family transcriptional regulator